MFTNLVDFGQVHDRGICPDVVWRNLLNADTTERASQINKPKMQLLDEFLPVFQATPIPAADIADDEELVGGFSPTSGPFLIVGLGLTAKMREPCGANDL